MYCVYVYVHVHVHACVFCMCARARSRERLSVLFPPCTYDAVLQWQGRRLPWRRIRFNRSSAEILIFFKSTAICSGVSYCACWRGHPASSLLPARGCGGNDPPQELKIDIWRTESPCADREMVLFGAEVRAYEEQKCRPGQLPRAR